MANNKLTFWQTVKLLRDPDKWKRCEWGMFDDELITKDGSVRFFANESVRFRNGGREELYVPGLFTFLVFQWLGPRLLRKVRARDAAR